VLCYRGAVSGKLLSISSSEAIKALKTDTRAGAQLVRRFRVSHCLVPTLCDTMCRTMSHTMCRLVGVARSVYDDNLTVDLIRVILV